MIVDDGGDATMMIHIGAAAEKEASVLDKQAGGEDERLLYAILKDVLKGDHGIWNRMVPEIRLLE